MKYSSLVAAQADVAPDAAVASCFQHRVGVEVHGEAHVADRSGGRILRRVMPWKPVPVEVDAMSVSQIAGRRDLVSRTDFRTPGTNTVT